MSKSSSQNSAKLFKSLSRVKNRCYKLLSPTLDHGKIQEKSLAGKIPDYKDTRARCIAEAEKRASRVPDRGRKIFVTPYFCY